MGRVGIPLIGSLRMLAKTAFFFPDHFGHAAYSASFERVHGSSIRPPAAPKAKKPAMRKRRGKRCFMHSRHACVNNSKNREIHLLRSSRKAWYEEADELRTPSNLQAIWRVFLNRSPSVSSSDQDHNNAAVAKALANQVQSSPSHKSSKSMF